MWAIACGAGTLTGCGQVGGGSVSGLTPVLLFTNQDGNASINVRVVDDHRRILSFSDLDTYDTVRLTLSSATNLTTSKVQTISGLAPGGQTTLSGAFTGVRPGNDYQLKADVYNSPDAVSGFTQSIVRGEGVAKDGNGNSVLTLAAGTALSVTVKVNAIGTIAFSGSTSLNVVSDFKVVMGDTLTVDSGLSSVNSPNVKRVDLVYKSATGVQQGSTLSQTVIPSSGTATLSWTVPTYTPTGASELGTLQLVGYDSLVGGNQLAFKTKAITVYQGASVTPVTLN
jgi:hypothetical protein